MSNYDAIAFPHSLGMYYTAVSQYRGFRKYGDESKSWAWPRMANPPIWTSFVALVRTNGGIGFRLGLNISASSQYLGDDLA